MDAKAGSIKMLHAIHKPAQERLIIFLSFQLVLTEIASMDMHSQPIYSEVKYSASLTLYRVSHHLPNLDGRARRAQQVQTGQLLQH